MHNDLEKAAALLQEQNLTFAAVCGEKKFISTSRGVAPLLDILDKDGDLHGFSAADKVIGKAAAFLYVLLSPLAIHTRIISVPALKVLKTYNIPIHYDMLTDAVRNRDNTGFCPMETAVRNTETPDAALFIIRRTREQISGKKNEDDSKTNRTQGFPG